MPRSTTPDPARTRVEGARAILPGAVFNFAIARVVTCGVVLASSEVRDAGYWLDQGQALRAPPAALAWALPLLEGSQAWLPALQVVCALATGLALIGFLLRWALPASALSALVLFAMPHFSGTPRHSMHLVWFLGVLALCPSGALLSFPQRIRAAHDERSAVTSTLGLNALRLLLGCAYFFPGLWKLRESGLAWIASDNLQNQMFWKWYQFGELPWLRIDGYPALVRWGAFGVVLFELCFPLLLWHRTSRWLAALAGVAFHRFAADFMFLPFSGLVACYVVLVDWARIWSWLQDLPGGGEEPSLIAAVRSLASSRLRDGRVAVAALGSLSVVAGALVAGHRGAMQTYPFACYPTFQWRAAAAMPDLWIAYLSHGVERFIRDSPAFGGVRSQARWGMAWRAAGLYGEVPEITRLLGYYRSLPRTLLAPVPATATLRFYSVLVDVTPSAWQNPPLRRQLIGEWSPRALPP